MYILLNFLLAYQIDKSLSSDPIDELAEKKLHTFQSKFKVAYITKGLGPNAETKVPKCNFTVGPKLNNSYIHEVGSSH